MSDFAKDKDVLISRQAAIELVDWYQHEFSECDYAFGELANELHKLPSAQPEITLEQAIDHLHELGWMQEHDRILTESAQERKKGKWVEKEVLSLDEPGIQLQSCKCSVCERYDSRPYMYFFSEPHFCPNCGAKMRGGDADA